VSASLTVSVVSGTVTVCRREAAGDRTSQPDPCRCFVEANHRTPSRGRNPYFLS